MKKLKEGGWFTPRGYAHLDYPPTFDQAYRLAADPKAVAKHSFLPLIGYKDIKRRYSTDNSNLSIPVRLRPRKVKEKQRDLRYASHRDAAIFSYYAFLLQNHYEKTLKSNFLDDVVIGYRSGLGSNIDLAAAAFTDIEMRGTVTALCFDIENFFPSIRHSVLKDGIQEILGENSLSPDWYQVFRNICAYSYIDLGELAILEGFDPDNPPRPLISNIAETMNRCRASKIICRNSSSHDVPQGTPISAVFANVSMLSFDKIISSWAAENNASYRRYSEDILILSPPDKENAVRDLISDQANKIGLTINDSKTEISRFSVTAGHCLADKPITYLGFSFDGQRVSLRSRTLSRYYRRMTYATRSVIRVAGRAGQPANKAFKRALISDFTHLGKRNFFSYAKRADSKFYNSIVKRQLRRHFQILLRKLTNKGR